MLKRYILHIEAHKRHLPRVSFKRAPRPGDRVVDGGVPGTLRRCPTCEEGFLHEPDLRKTRSKVLPPGPHTWRGSVCFECEANTSWCPYPPPKPGFLATFLADMVKNLSHASARPARPARSYHTPRPAMDFNAPTHVDLKVTGPKPETEELKVRVVPPAQHVELKADDAPEHVELKLDTPVSTPEQDPILKLEFEHDSPETLKLDYTLGTRSYNGGEIVWTHKAEYVVDKLEDNVLYLVRKDVWDARKKKAKHVELKAEDETPSEIVRLTFD